MENSRVSSVAQLSAWTDSMNKSKKEEVKKAAIEEDYDDEFEDYDDDFDDDAGAKPAPALVSQNKVSSRGIAEEKTHKTVSSAPPLKARVEEKEVVKPKGKTFEKMQISLNNPAHDSRRNRIKALLKSGVMDLQYESFSIFTQLPMTPLEFYNDRLRTNTGGFKQTATPTESNTREMEVNTDVINTEEKGIQFSYFDDEIPKNKPDDASRTNLSLFLQRSCAVVEQVLIENNESAGGGGGYNRGGKTLADEIRESVSLGSKSLFQKYDVSSVPLLTKFSSLHPNVFVTVHQANTNGSGVYFIWSTFSPESPKFVLAAVGVPSSVCFSSAESDLLLAGTQEGAIHMWDLTDNSNEVQREGSSSLVRTPTVSKHNISPLSQNSSRGKSNTFMESYNADSERHHMCAIVDIQSLGTSTQFVSMDESGLICFWAKAMGGVESGRSGKWDLQQQKYIQAVGTSYNSIFATIVDDFSTLLVSNKEGTVMKVTRFGEVVKPDKFQRKSHSLYLDISTKFDEDVSSGRAQIMHTSSVTALSVKTIKRTGTESSYVFLAGRMDGTMDLFHSLSSQPVLSWNVFDLRILCNCGQGGDENSLDRPSVVQVKWHTQFDTVFTVVDSAGYLFIFNLKISLQRPVFAERLESTRQTISLPLNSVDVSYAIDKIRPGKGAINITSAVSGALKTRKLSEELLFSNKNAGGSGLDDEFNWDLLLSKWSTDSLASQNVFFNFA